MSARWAPVRLGLARARIEVWNSLNSPLDLISMLLFGVVTLVVVAFLRAKVVPGMPVSFGALLLPGAVGMSIGSMGLNIMTQILTIEREDGTLLRAKAVPGGMTGYLIGKVGVVSGMTVVGILVLLVPGMFMVHDLALSGPGDWLTLLWVLVLGLVATIPLGAILGSLFPSPRSGGLVTLLFFGVSAISGIYYPLTHFPRWLQDIAQVLPIYWLGLGMRSAFLPGEMAAAELGGSWQHLETAAVLGGWAVVGLALAPIVLRRMASRESGSTMAARRARAMKRVG